MAVLWPRINVSLQAVAQVLLVIGLGVWLSARRGFDRKAIAAVSGVNWHVLMPALMFSSIVGAITPTNLVLMWPLMVLSVLHVLLGVVPALLLGWATRLPKDMCFFAVMAASLPNCGNLPWLFMPTIIRYYTPADQVTAQIQYSTGLTSVYTIIVVIITLVVPFLFKKPHDTLVLPRNSSIVMPRNGSNISLGTQETQEDEDEQQQQQQQQQAGEQHHQHHPHHPHHPYRQHHAQHDGDGTEQLQQQLQQQGLGGHLQHEQPHTMSGSQGVSPGATAWVVPAASAKDAAAVDLIAQQQQQHQHISRPPDTTAQLPAFDGLQDGHLPVFDQLQRPQQQHQQQHHFSHQPSVGGMDSFSSHRSSSFLLAHSRQLLGSFSKSFSRGVGRGLRRSASLVQLVWSYPTGWQPQRGAGRGPGRGQGRTLPGETSARPAWLQRLLSLCTAVLDHPVVNLPLGATIVGIACAAIGPVRGLLVNELAPLHWVWLSLGWVGAAAAPLATMQIGAELVQTAPVSDSMHVAQRVQWTANAIAILVKLVVVPLVNIVLLRLAGLSRLVPAEDAVYQLLMLVEGTVPAAVTLLVVCSRVYPDIRPLSSMLFWQYVASLFTLPAFLVWYLYMLEL